MVEHGLVEPVIGVTFDGAGLGSDGAIWGGEFLIGDYQHVTRVAHLRNVAMPGGEQATLEPWRMAAAHLLDAKLDLGLLDSVAAPTALRTVRGMVNQKFNSPLTSSMGRLFDAVAAIAGIRAKIRYDGQAAMELEWLANEISSSETYSWKVAEKNSELVDSPYQHSAPTWILDTRPLIRDIATDVARHIPASIIAQRFHSTVVEMIADICVRIREKWGITKVVCSGGVFMNGLLTSQSCARLSSAGFKVHYHRRVPANDGGLSLGQLAVASKIVGESYKSSAIADLDAL
jgi:hydrogenase maturation protein HypF